MRRNRVHTLAFPIAMPVAWAMGPYSRAESPLDPARIKAIAAMLRACPAGLGRPIGRDRLPGGAPIELKRDLLVGEDAELGSHEQLTGYLDDILVLGRSLSADEIEKLATQGAEACIGMLRSQ